MVDSKLFTYSPEVQSALAAKSIVALESTVIAHGLPRPQNLETARRLEKIVRDCGAIPATIAILDGKLCVGLSDQQIRFIADEKEIKKVSIRDLPIAIAEKWNGATTVASTSWIAQRAGIKVFATGGIGGVHRGSLPDISADLPALASTGIVVVCSGAKIVLDLAATREWLETYGITVVGYQCDEMPAFYSRRSGLPIDARADSPAGVVQLFRAQERLGIERALLITVPVPAEFEVPSEQLEASLNAALKEAESAQIAGRELTPFLLSRMAEASGGATLKANIALLENNARVAAKIAAALSA
ncbi:MAG TPA: pseudouridine-5-phosphate glycosidase [Blastocatellia bacterium]|jgi:pseudouridine-5'-phosphate glycosidase|nr:pseudouridine-5-phosphate glycosidase [Blastocatellia bacterium]HAF24686.1 pseudouridine-5-phosphate glycosidase [Blastocatellia bacterium]HCX31097.1 pseudouridine-5-phosphate glycosidase [Blastocatellia bacterium]